MHPICLPYTSNSKQRQDYSVQVLGFATDDLSSSKSTTLKVADMIVFSKDECNINLDEKLAKNDECKFLIENLVLAYSNPQQ